VKTTKQGGKKRRKYTKTCTQRINKHNENKNETQWV
jgi:hypothetical protein